MNGNVLPDTVIEKLIKEGSILNADPRNINASSLDLRLGHEKWKIMGSFLPLEGQKVSDALKSRDITDTTNLDREEFYMETSQPYVIKLAESLKLPKGITARIFNKSGCGRVGMSVKGLADGIPRFDHVPEGYSGDLYAEVCATAIQSVFMPGKTSMPQIRFYEGEPQPLSGVYLSMLLAKHPILVDNQGNPAYSESDLEQILSTGKMTFTADLSGDTLAYISRRGRTFNFTKRNEYEASDFFSRRFSRDGERKLTILPGDFAIINSKQNVRLPPKYAAEISPYSGDLGDLRSSYADLINAGHGFDENDPEVRGHIYFEVRARDVPIIIQDGQPIARFEIYEMGQEPRERYMQKRTTSFGDLSSFLPKQFRK